MTDVQTGLDPAFGALATFEAIGLEDLTELADLQTRRDRKYVVPVAEVVRLIPSLGSSARVLTIDERASFAYRSIYFDTPHLDAYLSAARRRPSRFKVRTRHYLDSGICALEVKTRDKRGLTVKHRMPCAVAEESGLSPSALRFVSGIEQTAGVADDLQQCLATTYVRSTLLLHDCDASRVTIDTNVQWSDLRGALLEFGAWAVVESKTPGRPSEFDRLLWRAGFRPVTISKYCTGLAALNPSLPANRWSRVLRQHFSTRPQDAWRAA